MSDTFRQGQSTINCRNFDRGIAKTVGKRCVWHDRGCRPGVSICRGGQIDGRRRQMRRWRGAVTLATRVFKLYTNMRMLEFSSSRKVMLLGCDTQARPLQYAKHVELQKNQTAKATTSLGDDCRLSDCNRFQWVTLSGREPTGPARTAAARRSSFPPRKDLSSPWSMTL